MSKVTVDIKGYRQLSPDEQALINRLKGVAIDVGEEVELVKQLGPQVDQRWVSIAQTHLQQGFMALIRAVAQPDSF